MENLHNQKMNTPATVVSSDIVGEKIIFDILINEKLAHVLVVKGLDRYHINVDGEDLGEVWKSTDDKTYHWENFKQTDHFYTKFFEPIEQKLDELHK
jgi:hypothetical protein